MDTSKWSQEAAIAQTAATAPAISERKIRTKNDQKQLNCPRCNSNNTKFCYYNNYSLTQPRHFCKTCRRYWTEGGSLRNIPVGGGSRKNKRSDAATSSSAPFSSSSSSSTTTTSSYMLKNPKFSVEAQDLNLGFRQVGGSGISGRQMGGDFMHEVLGLHEFRGGGLGLGFQVGAGGAADQDEGKFLFSSQNRGEGGDTQGFWNGMMGGGGNW